MGRREGSGRRWGRRQAAGGTDPVRLSSLLKTDGGQVTAVVCVGCTSPSSVRYAPPPRNALPWRPSGALPARRCHAGRGPTCRGWRARAPPARPSSGGGHTSPGSGPFGLQGRDWGEIGIVSFGAKMCLVELLLLLLLLCPAQALPHTLPLRRQSCKPRVHAGWPTRTL